MEGTGNRYFCVWQRKIDKEFYQSFYYILNANNSKSYAAINFSR